MFEQRAPELDPEALQCPLLLHKPGLTGHAQQEKDRCNQQYVWRLRPISAMLTHGAWILASWDTQMQSQY